jgi:TolA-binding protein
LQLAAVDYQKVLDEYGGSDAARFASFYIANIYFELKNYEQAAEYFRLHIDEYPVDDMMTVSAMAGLAHCHRAKGEMKEAADMFRSAYQKYPNSYLAEDCLYSGAMSYAEAGDKESARELWNLIRDERPGESNREMQMRQFLVEKGVLDPAIGLYD